MNTSKLKINPGLAGIILLACLFSGWQSLLLVVILMLLFCEVDDKIKSLIINVVTFYAAFAIVTTAWDIITGGVNVVLGLITKFLETINSFLDYSDQIDYSNFTNYFLTPVKNLVEMADSVVSFLFLIIKFTFIVSTIQNKPMKENPVSKKINEFTTKIVNYINNVAQPATTQGTSVPQQNVAPAQSNQQSQ